MMAEKEYLYDVEKIVGIKFVKGIRFYLVRWKGFLPNQDSWEPEYNCTDCSQAIGRFMRALEKYRAEREKQNIVDTDSDSDSDSDSGSKETRLDPDDYPSEDDDSYEDPPAFSKKPSKLKKKSCGPTNRKTKALSRRVVDESCGDSSPSTSKPLSGQSPVRGSSQPTSESSQVSKKRSSKSSSKQFSMKKSNQPDLRLREEAKVPDSSVESSYDPTEEDEDFFGYEKGKKISKIKGYVPSLDTFHVVYEDGEEEYLSRETVATLFPATLIKFYQDNAKIIRDESNEVNQVCQSIVQNNVNSLESLELEAVPPISSIPPVEYTFDPSLPLLDSD